MQPEDFFKQCLEWAESFGLLREPKEHKKQNVVIRKNLKNTDNNVPFFGFINPEEAESGPYSDFSLVFFPAVADQASSKYVMSLVVGSEGFKNDYELASNPGLRRKFLRLLPEDEKYYSFCKPKFTDIETAKDFSEIEKETGISLDKYKKVLSVGCLINANEPNDMLLVTAWIACYASIRKWATNGEYRKTVKYAFKNLQKTEILNKNKEDDETQIKNLLSTRRFVVLQGAPGTGKTYMAGKIAENEYQKVFFTQFHAETTYSDFVYGIFPKLNSANVEYEPRYGELCNSIKYAVEHKDEKVLLIIDEINRANLANVLGPVFYLFEPKRKNSTNAIEIGERSISEIPENLYVIATMNTADRSIAVVDFALRRRFAWYTIKPKYFSEEKKKVENKEEAKEVQNAAKELYKEVADIFDMYASDAELNLQPGGAYFMADTMEELNQKIEYELMPLIKEYLEEGLLTYAAGEFSDLFYRKIGKNLFE